MRAPTYCHTRGVGHRRRTPPPPVSSGGRLRVLETACGARAEERGGVHGVPGPQPRPHILRGELVPSKKRVLLKTSSVCSGWVCVTMPKLGRGRR
ncbi:hypothetical protein BC628DRAFT_793312 [Trametes gibbosa]|nr:hypothetical protein BC628DRAFT_793312 [Trametes gibbosa]